MADSFYLAPNATAKLVLQRFSEVEFFTQKTSIPNVQLIYPKVQAPQLQVPLPPQSMVYERFVLDFIVTEDFSNYRTLFEWMQSSINQPKIACYSDGALMLLSASRNVVQTVNFQNLMPIALGEITWITTDSSVRYQVCQAVFDYTKFVFQ